MAIVTKSPLTGTVTDSHHGGWSARARWAGFDGLLFRDAPRSRCTHTSKARRLSCGTPGPVGKGVHEVVKTSPRHGGDDVSVIAIGQAGENQVRYASLINENDRASGRGGTGCVAGASLKAVVIKAKKALKPANKDDFKEAHKRALA
jgi:aldehyde:ferredoxin oxidoreductase